MPWTNAPLVVYHGTDEDAAVRIQAVGIDLAVCRLRADFGRGFYVTSSLHQAQQWANQKALRSPRGGRSAVLTFDLDRDEVANLDDHLAFVMQGSDFFDFVRYNRLGNNDHARRSAVPYDVVYGPVAAYPQSLTFLNCDQICFLNQNALSSLRGPRRDINYGSPIFL